MKQRFHVAVLFFAMAMVSTFAGGQETRNSINFNQEPAAFNAYWYAGKAEITRFKLEQARYGQIREGDAVLIFVTEDFLTNAQVKKDFGNDEAYKVLKLNFTKKFNTGIYPYSLMTSVFSPVDVDRAQTTKVSFSSQEWCGNLYMQINLRNGAYQAKVHSYFQGEGDREFKLPAVLLEDEILTRVRLAPNRLPVGDIEIIPSLQHAGLSHKELNVEKATARLYQGEEPRVSGEQMAVYEVSYRKAERKLVVYFEKESPFKIVGWIETHRSGFGKNAKTLTTLARRTHTMMSDYWNKNSNADRSLRKSLGLSP